MKVVESEVSAPQRPHEKRTSAESRCVDSWILAGDDGVWRRAHRTPRRALFTPFKVAAGPDKSTILKKIRVTRGKYLDTNEAFEVIDDFTNGANSHRVLRAGWLGETEFHEANDYIERTEKPVKPSLDKVRTEPKRTIAWADQEDDDGPINELFLKADTEVDGQCTDLFPKADMKDDGHDIEFLSTANAKGAGRVTKLFPNLSNSLDSLTVREVSPVLNARTDTAGRHCSGEAREFNCVRTNCQEPSSTPQALHVLSSDAQVRTARGVGECQMDTGRYGYPYETRTDTRRQLCYRLDRPAVGHRAGAHARLAHSLMLRNAII